MRTFPILVLVALILTGCNLNAGALPTPNDQNIIYVTATVALPTPNAEGMVLITATPDPNQAPVDLGGGQGVQPEVVATEIPTLAYAPQEELVAANQKYVNGYFEEAVGMYQALLGHGESVPPDIRAEAAFRLAQSALREGLFNDAVTSLTQLITNFPQNDLAIGAYFLRGDAYLGLSQWQAAIDDFSQYLSLRPGVIDSYAYERIADAQLALGQTDAALASYDLALNANRTLVPLLVLREKVARILVNIGRVNAAVAQYDAILAVAKNAPYRASIDFTAGQALLNSGDTAGGLARVRRVFDSYRETATAYPAMQILLQNNVPIDGLTRGKIAFQYGDYPGAIAAFNEYSSSNTLDKIPAEMYLLIGRAYREIGNSQAAFVAFQTVIDSYPTDSLFGAALLEQGRTRFLSGDVTGAIQSYLRIADSYGYLFDVAAEALWRVGYLYGTNNDPVRSRETFLRMAQEFPQSTWTTNGLFLAASAAVTNQEWGTAEDLYARIATLARGDDQAAAYYWVGRLATQRGDAAAAATAYAQAAATAPDSYFASRASDIQAGRPPFQAPAQLNLNYNEAAECDAAEEWLRSTFQITQAGDLSALSPELAADPRLIRGHELWSVGATSEALEEFTSLLDEARTAGNALTSYQLALYLRDLGAYMSSVVASADVITAARIPTLSAPACIARMRYPVHYVDLVLEQQANYGIDPLLMFSLLRQESLFNASASSVVGARGLMQVMPATGQYIAGSLGYMTFQDSDLLRPYVSLQFGAYYLHEQLTRFDNNVAAALAAYNAGPGRAIDWYKLSGGDIDLLMTTITFEETRSYVERIYNNYSFYRALYGA